MASSLCRFGAVWASLMLAMQTIVSAQETPPAEQFFKNITVMKGVPANEVSVGMHLIKTALGVECTHCHIEGQFAEDAKPMKDKARKMYVMMSEINRTQFDGKPVVTCYTCHKGHAIPEGTPTLPAPSVKSEEGRETKTFLPTVDLLLTNYIAALGGEQAMRKVTTRLITATQDIPTGPGGSVPTPATLERSMKAPNLIVDVFKTDQYTISNGFDGTVSWARGQSGNVTSPASGGQGEAERARRAAAFYEPLTLRQQYPALAVDRIENVNGRDVYVVTGAPERNTPERLYFDMQTGLLVRKWTYIQTPIGKSPFQMDFDDYRDTGSGVKIPFMIRMSPAGPRTETETTSTLRITKVQDNVPLDDTRFVKPSPPPHQ